MPTLIETYSRSTGLKIDKPFLREDFFPLPFDKYITLCAGSNQGAKNYDYWQEVVNLLNPIISKFGISIVTLGSKDDPIPAGSYDLRGKTSFQQSFYLIKRALCHIGNDSWCTHAAGWSNTPLVALYGSTDANIHGPYWKGPKTVLLSSHRMGKKPSFVSQESPKMINFIPPEEVANNVLKILGLTERILEKTIYIGPLYNTTLLEWIPNYSIDPSFNSNLPLTVRMDLHHDEQILAQTLSTGRKVNIVTKKPINLGIISTFKDNILTYNHEMDNECPVDYVRHIKSLLGRNMWFSRLSDETSLNQLKFNFFEVCNLEKAVDKTKEDFIKEAGVYLNLNKPLDISDISDKISFRTNKYVLSNGKIFASHAHQQSDIQISSSNKIIDNDLFWKEANHFLFYL